MFSYQQKLLPVTSVSSVVKDFPPYPNFSKNVQIVSIPR
jgi:hypothetical protein